MNKTFLLVITFCIFTVQCQKKHFSCSKKCVCCKTNIKKSETIDSVPLGVKSLLFAYKEHIKEYNNGFLIFRDGTKILYDDKKKKNFDGILDDASPKDMFSFNYYSGSKPGYLQDAGRSRCEKLFKKMYGSSEDEVKSHLDTINWFGGKVTFSSINGAKDSLMAVERELNNYPKLQLYLKSSGTFYWRKVRSANRQSAHSYGIAIDIGVKYSDYWLWNNPDKKETDSIDYINRIPKKIVEIFESHGFIWGGRWYHYDTMHFEYRPELLHYYQLKGHL